jgi:hypothetical protein
VLVQPVHLTDGDDDAMPFVSAEGDHGAMKVTRKSVGRLLAHAATAPGLARACLAVSGNAGA